MLISRRLRRNRKPKQKKKKLIVYVVLPSLILTPIFFLIFITSIIPIYLNYDVIWHVQLLIFNAFQNVFFVDFTSLMLVVIIRIENPFPIVIKPRGPNAYMYNTIIVIANVDLLGHGVLVMNP